MKHDRLMKRPKRFCVDCNQERFVTVVSHKTFAMYHCETCKTEISRAGDGESKHGKLTVRGLDVRSIPEEMSEGANLLDLALGNPDVLSEEHAIWQPRDLVVEEEREDRLRLFKASISGLTARQKQVLEAVDFHGTHELAAMALGISREGVTRTLEQIKIKLSKHTAQADNQGLKGKHTL